MWFNNPNNFLPVISIVISIFIVVGGGVAFFSGRGRENSLIQGQTIDALKARIETLESQVESDEREMEHLRQVITTIRQALARRGLHIEIQGNFVTLVDATDGSASTSPSKPPATKKLAAKSTKSRPPIKLTPISNEDDNDSTA
ncbi:MAG TPA: hypothetical protein VFN23_07050 [Ktedonobacteraceae bacterium]|nr:hypothetical protein [Ktedonobacteraceae bacterium]